MGAISFLLPPELNAEQVRELGRACVSGGPDNMPWPTEARAEPGRLVLRRDVDESGNVLVPWDVPGVGRVMASTATLIERPEPYPLLTELTRGKVNQLRGQAADWAGAGFLSLPPDLAEAVRRLNREFSKAVTQPPGEGTALAQGVLGQGYRAAADMVKAYVSQMLALRHQRQPRLDTGWGCCLGGQAVEGAQATALEQVCNCVCLSFAWNEVEPAEGSYNWEPFETLLAWAESRGLPVIAGPLIDFTPARLPDWLWLWDGDVPSLAAFMCGYVEAVVRRYAKRISCWQLCAATNSASLLGLGEDEFLGLTARFLETARQVEPKLELSLGIAQPWGEYMAIEDRTHSPLYFAETLIRYGLNLGALDLEMVMGVWPRGSYCRDLLDTSRLLDAYAQLGLPLRVTLGYPSSRAPDPQANPELAVDAGHWGRAVDADAQAEWAEAFGALVLCKPSVRAVRWVHLGDGAPHQFPHCGLFDARGKPKPALGRLRDLRENHLR